MTLTTNIRPPGVAGTFYSGDKMILERELSLFFEAAPVVESSRPVAAIIAPHAGYIYSGGVAARAYRQILGAKYRRVVILAPSHHEEFPFASIYNGPGYRTPLGEIEIDLGAAQELTAFDSRIQFSEAGHGLKEHSLEVQLPFLQWSLNKFKLIPISIGRQEFELMKILGEALPKVLPPGESLIVASSDLSHFHPDDRARMLDQVARENIEKFNEDELWEDINARRTQMCGYGPVIAAMKAARNMGAEEAKVLLYRNSGDITGNRDDVVGYLSAILY